MKRIYLSLIFISILFSANTQEAEPILSIAIKFESKEWYVEQAQLWKEKTKINPKNEDNWLQYIRAVYYSNPSDSTYEIVFEELEQNVPNSFPYYYLKHRIYPESDEYLDSAYAKNPEYTDLFEAQLVRGLINGDKATQVLFSEKLLNSDEEDVSLYHWSYNMLQSLEPNSILFTHGDNDSFGAWILQNAKNVRSDVFVLNTSLLMDSTYCNLNWKQLLPNETWVSIEDFYKKNKIEWDNGQSYIVWLMKKLEESERAIHFTVWTPEYIKKEFDDDDLFLTGLTYRYDPERKFSSIAALRKNFEKVYKLDYIEQRYFSNIWDEKAKYMNKSYLSGLLKLYVHYQKTGEKEKLDRVEHLIQVIEPNQTKLEEYGAYIESETGEKPVQFNGLYVKTKTLLKKYKQIDENLFASNTEETNYEYRLFLQDLKENEPANYKKYVPDTTLWKKKFSESTNNPMVNLYNWHPAYQEYPVVNINKEAAIAYCNWLTLQYNNDPKRKIDEVKFFIPCEEEWKKAAGNIGPIKNQKECYLVNGYWKDEDGKGRLFDDGGFHMVKSESYFENDKGLYCIYGNVSEIILDKSYSKGGGWLTEYKNMNANGKYEAAPHPTVGFRVFMRIIQK